MGNTQVTILTNSQSVPLAISRPLQQSGQEYIWVIYEAVRKAKLRNNRFRGI